MTLSFPGSWPDERKPDKVIEITLHDGKPALTEKGQDKPGPVVAVVGQTVRWVNRDSRTHHFVSTAEFKGKPVIDTGEIEPGKHYDLILDNDLYRAAGGKTANVVMIKFRSRGKQPDPAGELQVLSPAKR
jgi:hypothetical protein